MLNEGFFSRGEFFSSLLWLCFSLIFSSFFSTESVFDLFFLTILTCELSLFLSYLRLGLSQSIVFIGLFVLCLRFSLLFLVFVGVDFGE